MKKKNIYFSIKGFLLYDDHWREGASTPVGESVSMPSYQDSDLVIDDPDTYSDFRIYFMKQ